MDRYIMTQNCILQFDMIRVRSGIIEPLPKLFYELRYSPDQPRDEHGRFTFGSGGGNSEKSLTKDDVSGIIRLRINEFDKSDPLYYEAFSIEEEPGFEDVCAHGNPKSIEVNINGQKVVLNAHDYAEHLRSNGYNGEDLRLASCSTGKGDNSFAQQLSKELGNKVKAPDDDVFYIPDEGVLYVGSRYSNVGKWRIFDKGVEIND